MRWLTAGLLSVFLLLLWVGKITGAAIEKDAAQTVQMALNLERHGVIAMEPAPPLRATNYREPLPVLINAAGIRLIDASMGQAPQADYFEGRRVQLLKYQNVLWLGLLSLGAFFAVRLFTGSHYVGLLGALLVNYPFWGSHSAADLVDNLYTDIAADAGLVWASLLLALALRGRGLLRYVLCGLAFGLLALVKAAALYIFIGSLGVLAVALLMTRSMPLRAVVVRIVATTVAFACVVAPWMYRNQTLFGSPAISQRAGVVLMYRAAYDLMTDEEYRGTFYVWAPDRLKAVLGRTLGFSPADLQHGGRLQRINEGHADFADEDLAAERRAAPEQTLTYYRQARAERLKMQRRLAAAGSAQPEVEADAALKSHAMEIIRQHLRRHIELTIPFLWRGATLTFPVLLVALFVALRRSSPELLLFAAPAFGLVMLHALFSHFIGRYGLPALSVSTVLLLIAANYCAEQLYYSVLARRRRFAS